tara:strand:+ start:80 stop:343 length:264 start_codon:yes stop_codon:yes gene_type:complete
MKINIEDEMVLAQMYSTERALGELCKSILCDVPTHDGSLYGRSKSIAPMKIELCKHHFIKLIAILKTSGDFNRSEEEKLNEMYNQIK